MRISGWMGVPVDFGLRRNLRTAVETARFSGLIITEKRVDNSGFLYQLL